MRHMARARAVLGTPAGRPAAATGQVARVAGLVRRGAVAMRRRAPAAMGGAITLAVATGHLGAMVLPGVTARQAASANRARRGARGGTARQGRPGTAGAGGAPPPGRRPVASGPPLG